MATRNTPALLDFFSRVQDAQSLPAPTARAVPGSASLAVDIPSPPPVEPMEAEPESNSLEELSAMLERQDAERAAQQPRMQRRRRPAKDARFEALKAMYKPDLQKLSQKLMQKLMTMENTGSAIPPEEMAGGPEFIRAAQLSPVIQERLGAAGLNPLGFYAKDFTPIELGILQNYGRTPEDK